MSGRLPEWKQEMLKYCPAGQLNHNAGTQIGYKVDGHQKFGTIVTQESHNGCPLLLFNVRDEDGEFEKVDLKDAKDRFDGVVYDNDAFMLALIREQIAARSAQ